MLESANIPDIPASELREAILSDQLDLAFQPKIILATDALAGVEALARWQHPRLGSVPPSLFIPLAERTGLIDQLTEWVFKTAMREWCAWRDVGIIIDVAVNISVQSLDDARFPDWVEALCREYGLPCRHLIIELTESAAQHAVKLMDGMARLRLKGVKISLDDFGTGYSSLIQLHQLPFNEIKIDRHFVCDADTSWDSRVIIKSIIDLAHNLEMTVTAEGIERLPVLDLLTSLGCDQVQGFLLAEPMAGIELPAWLQRRDSGLLQHVG